MALWRIIYLEHQLDFALLNWRDPGDWELPEIGMVKSNVTAKGWNITFFRIFISHSIHKGS